MFTVWEPIMQKRFSVGSHHVITPLRLLCVLKAPPHTHTHAPHTHTHSSLHPAHFPLYLTRCECHVVLCGTFACVAVSGGEVCLLCDRDKKKRKKNSPPPPPRVVCCVIWSLALTVTNTPPLCGWLRAIWWSCMQSVPSDTWSWQHESHSARESLLGLSHCYITTTTQNKQQLRNNL